jgi:toxin ParE1/3/4
MARAHYTPEADQDLIRIGTYIARENPTAAMRWVALIEGVCNLLATQPEIGHSLKTLRFGNVRRHAVGNYLIYYRPAEDGVLILVVTHGARDRGNLV